MERKLHRLVNKKLLQKFVGAAITILLMVVITAYIYVHVNRDELGNALENKLEETFHGNVQIEKVRLSVFGDFPHFSLTLLNTTVKDTLYDEYLLNIGKIYLRVGIFDLLYRRINVR